MKKTLLKKLLLVILTIGILIPPLPLQGKAAASKITSKKFDGYCENKHDI